MTINEKMLCAIILTLMVAFVLLALSSCTDASKAMEMEWRIAKCEKKHGKPCEIYARVIE